MSRIIFATLLLMFLTHVARANPTADFLTADMAVRDMNPSAASVYYDRLLRDKNIRQHIKTQSARAYIMAGRYQKAETIKAGSLSQILKAIGLIKKGEWQKASKILDSLSGSSDDIIVQNWAVHFMRVWALAGDGKAAQSLGLLQEFPDIRAAEMVLNEEQHLSAYLNSDTPSASEPVKRLANIFVQFSGLLNEDFPQDSMIYARLAAYLNNQNIEAVYLISEIFATYNHYDSAIDILQNFKTADFALPIDLQINYYRQLIGQYELAERQLLDLRKQHQGNREVRQALASFYRYQEQYNKAISLYDEDIASFDKDNISRAEKSLTFYYRGIAFERLGDWQQAEKDLLKAHELDGDNPYIMNYLGYSWVDKGENLELAFALLKRASELRQHNGAIADSLGWAYYKLENYNSAIAYLEKAVVLSPNEAVIIDHLGDAYWQVGRHLEAQFQWKRALKLADLTDELRTIIERKLQMAKDGSAIAFDSL